MKTAERNNDGLKTFGLLNTLFWTIDVYLDASQLVRSARWEVQLFNQRLRTTSDPGPDDGGGYRH